MAESKAHLSDQKSSLAEIKPLVRETAFVQNRGLRAFYIFALTVSIATWFFAIRAPLRVDETGSYWQICGGFWEIWPRQYISLCPPGYFYILWLSTKLLGTSEIALRVPSVLAMLAAVYLLYLSARKLMDRQFAAIACIIFVLNYTVVFSAIDVRPYAFGVLFTNAAILALLHLRSNDSAWLAALFGLLAAGIVHFHYLLGAVLPAFLIFFVAMKAYDRKILFRQRCIALAVFMVACIPLAPGLSYLFHTAGTHVVVPNSSLFALLYAFTPGWLIPSAVLTALFFGLRGRPIQQIRIEKWCIFFCACLAAIPVLILYGVTAGTSFNVFSAMYHHLSAIPGISLCWALALYRFRSNAVRLSFCVVFVGLTVTSYPASPNFGRHDYSWKSALQVAQEMSSKDNTPVAICSNFIEANYMAMPTESPKSDRLFAPLSYYKLTAPIVPLPETLNDETKRVFLPFLREEEQKHERFLAVGAVGPMFSSPALDWMARTAGESYSVRVVGTFDNVEVLEFVSRADTAARKQ